MRKDIEVGADSASELSPLNSLEQTLLATYDFLKHMSTLSIVAMGGMLGLAQGSGAKISKGMFASVALMGICGAMSLLFMTMAAATQISQRVHRTSKVFALVMVYVVLALFAASIGAFVPALLHGMA